MGLFSKKKIYVASSIYNLAGDPLERGNFLRSTVANVILDPNRSGRPIGRAILDTHLKGPAVRQRAFHRWSQQHYTLGAIEAGISRSTDIEGFDVSPYVPVAENYEASVQSARAEDADFFMWAEQHILETRPEDLNTAWTCDHDPATNLITIQYEDLSEEVIPATNFDGSKRYLYVTYIERLPESLPATWVTKIWIYQIGSGIVALDNICAATPIESEFFPFIPVRMWNKAIDHEDYSDIFPDCAKAYKKYADRDISELLAKIEDNENVGDIDHAFVVFGVPLNTDDNAGRRYIYEFFRELIGHQSVTREMYETWRLGVIAENFLYSGPKGYSNSITLKSTQELNAPYHITISWSCIDERIYVGVGKEGAKPGDVWLQMGRELGADEADYTYYDDFGVLQYRREYLDIEELDIYYQVDADTYKVIRVSGLVHSNRVYGSKAIEIGPREALADTDESGFFIPMHGPTLKKLPIVSGTQACVGNALLILNSYVVVKLKWYQIGFFRILFSIVLAVISAFVFPGAGGILGPHFAVGSSMGFTGLMATIAGSIANTLAAIVLSTVLNAVGGIFEKLGLVLNVLMSFVAGEFFGNLFSTGTFSFNFTEMFSASNLIRLTGAVSQGVQQWSQAQLTGIQNQLIGLNTWFEEESERIENLTHELLGYSGVLINPLQFTQLGQTAPRVESSDSFLARTLLTGHDIADVSLNVIENFAEISLQLPDYTS